MQNIIGRKRSLAPCLGFKWVFLERKMHRWLFYPFQTMNIWRFICRASKLWDVFEPLPSLQSEYLRTASDLLWAFEQGWWLLCGAAVFLPATLRSSCLPLGAKADGSWDIHSFLFIWIVLWFLWVPQDNPFVCNKRLLQLSNQFDKYKSMLLFSSWYHHVQQPKNLTHLKLFSVEGKHLFTSTEVSLCTDWTATRWDEWPHLPESAGDW